MADTKTDPVLILVRVMQEEDMTQDEVAYLGGIAAATVNRWLNRRTVLTEKKLSTVLTAMGKNPVVYGLKPPRTGKLPDAAPAWFLAFQEQQAEHNKAVIRKLESIERKLARR